MDGGNDAGRGISSPCSPGSGQGSTERPEISATGTMSSPQPPRDDPESKAEGSPFPRTSHAEDDDEDPTPRQSDFLRLRNATHSALTPRPTNDDPTPRQSDFLPSSTTPAAASTTRSSSAGHLTPITSASSARGPPAATPATHSASMPSLLASAPSDLAFRNWEGYGGVDGAPTRQTAGTSESAPRVFVQRPPGPRGTAPRGEVMGGASAGGARGWEATVAVRAGVSSARGQGSAASGPQGHPASGGQGTIPVRDSVSLADRDRLTGIARQANRLMEGRERGEQGGDEDMDGRGNGSGKRERGV